MTDMQRYSNRLNAATMLLQAFTKAASDLMTQIITDKQIEDVGPMVDEICDIIVDVNRKIKWECDYYTERFHEAQEAANILRKEEMNERIEILGENKSGQ